VRPRRQADEALVRLAELREHLPHLPLGDRLVQHGEDGADRRPRLVVVQRHDMDDAPDELRGREPLGLAPADLRIP
jgi:hypothetical protein